MITIGKLDETPVGTIWVAGSDAGLVAVSLWDGETRFAGEVVRLTGAAPDTVGRANATNPLPIIIPCHRILGADGKLHGYGARGGLETKAWLLRLEGSWLL